MIVINNTTVKKKVRVELSEGDLKNIIIDAIKTNPELKNAFKNVKQVFMDNIEFDISSGGMLRHAIIEVTTEEHKKG